MLNRYRKYLRRAAARDTARRIKKAAPGATLSLIVWDIERQNAYLDCGWHPYSETPRIDPDSNLAWTEMTLHLDTPA